MEEKVELLIIREKDFIVNQEKTVQSDLLKNDFEHNLREKSDSLTAMSWEEPTNPINPEPPQDQFPSFGGPQFGMNDQDSKGKGFRGWVNKYGSSVILPIIALLILAGGIYLYASQKSQPTTPSFSTEELGNIQEQTTDLTETPAEEIAATPSEQKSQETAIETIIPEGKKEQGKIIEKAVKGNGVTHLARRALTDYLKDHPQDLTNEHKVFVEDYLKDKTGSKTLEVGEEISFSEDLIKEAIDASMNLTAGQLKNLEKYSALVAW